MDAAAHLLLCFFLLLITSPDPSYGTTEETFTAHQTLSGNQTIVSAGGNFVLGFFQPDTSSSRYYIGMWYNMSRVSIQTIVWVANRDNPVTDKYSSQLRFFNGDLALFTDNQSKTPVWSTDLNSTTTTTTNNNSSGRGAVVAVLQDDGNFVLKDGDNSTIWQSFDNPTHTWLPGAKLGLNKRTKKDQQLTAWTNTNDPATGLFSLVLDPDGSSQYLIMWNRTVEYWTSGAWDEQTQVFSLVPEMTENYIYTFQYVNNTNESYFIYSLRDPNSTTISKLVMDVTGQIKQLTWIDDSQQWNQFWSQPRQQCEVYDYCGAFGSCSQTSLQSCTCLDGFVPLDAGDWALSGYSKGCTRTTPLQCGKSSRTPRSHQDRFWVYPNIGFPGNSLSVASASEEECQSTCFNNCSCTAYAYDDDGGGCSIWIGELLNLNSANATATGTLYVRLAASDFPSSSNKKIIVSIVAGSAAGVLAFLCLALVVWRQKKKRQRFGATRIVEGSLVAFTFRDLQTATRNFSDKLGGGGFGYVFKGTLPDSSVVAVKRLESITQGEKQFRSEVSTIGTIQHVNLVRLRGFCSEGERKLLVYDYMPNGSLDAHLFHHGGTTTVGATAKNKILDWKTRYQIALGTARGLAYLHEKCRDCIIHCDIKPENILLDAELCPKVADFGLAKLVGREFSRVLTTMRGTRGYLAPEWISGVAITAKADVYSYGMMVFELISGRRNTEQSKDGKITFFPTWAVSRMTEEGEGIIISIVDTHLEGNADAQEVMKLCKVACWCIQDEEDHRPSMGQVVQILEGVSDVSMPPIPRSLQVFQDHEHIVFFTESSSSETSQATSNASASSSQTTANTSSTNTYSPVDVPKFRSAEPLLRRARSVQSLEEEHVLTPRNQFGFLSQG
ncbi:hypothetical protein Dimus_009620 [Dionaea muscipula]